MARGGFSVNIVDRGLTKLLKRVKDMPDDAHASVGVIAPSDPETALIARVHELGLGTAPQRSFLRRTIVAGKQRYAALAKRDFTAAPEGKITFERALSLVGIEIKADVQATIIRGVPPALKPATVKRKRRLGLPRPKTALYATGKLYEAIKMRITKGRADA
jgi:hypothetical protein